MKLIAIGLSLVIAAFAAVGLVSPDGFLALLDRLVTPGGLAFGAAFRIVLRAALWIVAEESRAPRTLRAVGALLVVAGIVIPLVGVDAFRGLAEVWRELGPAVIRVWAVLAMALGAALVYAVKPVWTR